MRAILLAVMLATAGLAGCLSGDDGDTPNLENTASAGENTGGIQGVVTDPAVQPVQGAEVALAETGATTTTASDGSFAVSEVFPGTYTLQVRAEGFVSSEQEVQVASGEVQQVDVVLAHVVGLKPYLQQQELSGFVECSARAFVGVAVCAFPNSLAGGNATNDRFLIPFTMEENPWQMVSELEWQATQPLGSRLDFIIEPNGLPNDNKTSFGAAEGESPLIVRTDRERFREVDKNTTAVCEGDKDPQSSISADPEAYCNRNFVEEGGEGWIRVFVAHAVEPTQMPEQVPCVEGICAGGADMGAGLGLQQEFHAVVTLFYHAPACPDYSLFEGNECRQEAQPRTTATNATENGTGNDTDPSGPLSTFSANVASMDLGGTGAESLPDW